MTDPIADLNDAFQRQAVRLGEELKKNRQLDSELAAANAKITHAREALREKIKGCCGPSAGEGFCESFGCSTLEKIAGMLE